MHPEPETERARNEVDETQQQMRGRRTPARAMTVARRLVSGTAGQLALAVVVLTASVDAQDPGALAERVLASREYQPELPPARGLDGGRRVARVEGSTVRDGDPHRAMRRDGRSRLGGS